MSSASSARRAPPVASAPSPLPAITMKACLSLSLSRSARGSALPCSALLCSALLCWAALGACGDTATVPVDGAQGDTGSADVAADIAARLSAETEVSESTIRMLSSIGRSVADPETVHIEVAGEADKAQIEAIVMASLADWRGVRDRLIAGHYELY